MVNPEPRRDPENIERSKLKPFTSNPGDRVLDIGCGDGRLTWFYARNAGSVVGMDLKMEKLRSAHQAPPETATAKVHFIGARGEAIPFVDETFDLALFSWSL